MNPTPQGIAPVSLTEYGLQSIADQHTNATSVPVGARHPEAPLLERRHMHRGQLLGHIAWMATEIDQLRADLADGDRKYRHLAAAAQAEQEATAEAMAAADREIAALRAQLAAVHDDPAADLPGTVRIQPDSQSRVVLTGEQSRSPWLDIVMAPRLDAVRWFSHAEVVGWRRGTPVEGTPAAKAAKQ